MRKLKLALEDLEVESFLTGRGASPDGTVLGHDATTVVVEEKEDDIGEEESSEYCHWTVFIYNETELHTCAYSCNYSCPMCEA
jgi:hypothetical protein